MKQLPNIWITIFFAAILVTGLSFVLPKDEEKYMAELFWARKTFAPKKFDVVVMGDSRVYRGISPGIIEKRLPEMNVLNFAYSNGGLNTTMFEAAEQKLAENEKQKIILLGISANTVTGYSAGNDQYQQELNRPREEILERFYLNPILYWFSPTAPKKLRKHFSMVEDTAFYRNKYFMDGYVESEKFPVDTTAAISSYIDDFTNYKVEEKYLKTLFEQVKKWGRHEILVVGFTPPVSRPMQMLEDTLGLFDVAKIKSGFEMAGGHWVDINPANYRTYDGSHLEIESARILSDEIAVYIEKLIDYKIADTSSTISELPVKLLPNNKK